MKLRTTAVIVPCLLLVVTISGLLTACSTPGIYHQVQSGETLGQIARAYDRSEAQLARVNGIAAPQPLRKGAKLFIPGATALRQTGTASLSQSGATSATPPARRVVSKSALSSAPSKKLLSKDKAAREIGESPAVKNFPPVVAPGHFTWPLQGALLRRYGDQNPFPCKGIEISAPPGTPVLAAAAGRVIYSGDGISSFGNMIILRHDGDFYSVYAFTQKNFVRVGSFVSQKERIALSGVPPQGRSPRLYFELRYHKEPLDPTFYLP